MTKLVRAEVSNILGIKLAEIEFDPDGGLIVVGGENGAGKSSLLDALRWGLDGAKPKGKELLHHGAEKGVVTLQLAGEVVEVRRAVTEKGTTIKVSGSSGSELKRPQGVLDAIVGTFGLDPTAFLLLSDAEQAKRVQEVMGVNFGDLDARHKALFDARTDANRRVRDAEGELRQMPRPEPGDPSAPVVIADLLEAVAEADAADRDVKSAEVGLEAKRSQLAACKDEISRLELLLATEREKLAAVVEEGKALRKKHEDATARVLDLAAAGRDAGTLRAKLADAEAINARAAVAQRRAAAEAKLRDLEDKAAKADQALQALAEERAARIASAPLTIPGVDIVDGAVHYGGAPLAEASDGQRLRVAFEIAAAGAPDMRVLFIRHGALLDSANRRIIADLARERGYTVVMEVVGSGGIDICVENGEARKVYE